MNLPTNHRLVTPEELANGPLPGLKHRNKWADSPWKDWPHQKIIAEDFIGNDFCIPAVPAAEEKGDGQQLFREWCGNSYEWDALTDLERQRWNRLASRRPTPAIQQAVEALEAVEKVMRGEPLRASDLQLVPKALTALRHLNGEVRG